MIPAPSHILNNEMLAYRVVYLLPIDSNIADNVEGVKNCYVKDLDGTSLTHKSIEVITQRVKRLE
jgi:hypothetical protein